MDPTLAEQQPIGTGHRIVDRHQPSVTVEYRKHPEFWAGDPFIERWHEPIIPEYANQYAQFTRGAITNFTPTARDVMLLQSDVPESVIIAHEIPQDTASIHKWGKFETDSRPWKDERVRIAFRQSIDYTSIAEFLSNKEAFEAAGIPVEVSMMTHSIHDPAFWLDPVKGELGDLSANYLFDLAAAKQLISAAGHEIVDLPYYVSGTEELPDAEQLVQDNLGSSGTFNVELIQVPRNEYRTIVNIDFAYAGVSSQNSGSENDVDYQLYRYYHTNRIGGVAFPDGRLDELAAAQRGEMDPEKRIVIMKDIQLYLAEKFFQNPGRSMYTLFSFRWPWLHNSNYANNNGSIGDIGGHPELGGHLHWLDADMPGRDG
jgi:ABC-type transport system substrate-binding protein